MLVNGSCSRFADLVAGGCLLVRQVCCAGSAGRQRPGVFLWLLSLHFQVWDKTGQFDAEALIKMLSACVWQCYGSGLNGHIAALQCGAGVLAWSDVASSATGLGAFSFPKRLLLCCRKNRNIHVCASAPLWWDPTWSPASSSGAPSSRKTWSCWNGSRGGHKDDPRAGAPLLWGKAERVGLVQPGEGCGETLEQPASTWRGPARKMGKIFSAGLVAIGQGVMA